MLVSTRTYNVLKNFEGVNDSLLLREGKRQLTMDPDEGLLVEAILDEEIPRESGIYNLANFIGNLSNLDNPSLEFDNDKAIDMVDKDTRVTFYTCNPTLLKAPEVGTQIKLETIDVSFKLSRTLFAKALKIAAINEQETIAFVRQDNKLSIVVSNSGKLKSKNDALGNKGVIVICDDEGKDVSVSFPRSFLEKLMDADYDVTVDVTNYDPGVAVFSTDNGNLRYFLSAME